MTTPNTLTRQRVQEGSTLEEETEDLSLPAVICWGCRGKLYPLTLFQNGKVFYACRCGKATAEMGPNR